MAQSYENVLRLVLVVLILFFIASAMRILDSSTGNFIGLGSLHRESRPDLYTVGLREALKYGCADTDGGDNAIVKGVVRYRVDGKALMDIDRCIDPDTLLELVCLGNAGTSNIGTEVITITHNCKAGCVDGVCVAETVAERQGYPYNY